MATIDIQIREARSGDAAAISAAHNAAWQNVYSGIIPGMTLNRMIARRDLTWWKKAIGNGGNIRVLVFGEDIAGYASIRRNFRGGYRVMGEICELYLKPEYQGTGLGGRLFLETLKAVRRKYGSGCIVWALRQNDRACSFYRHMGGKEVAVSVDRFDGVALEKVAFVWD